MANILTTNPMQIDTAGVILTKGKYFHINTLSWMPAADVDDLVISDADGNIIYQTKAGDISDQGYVYEFALDLQNNNGITVTTIDGGKLLLYMY